ncbi:histidine ammonia-lyase [Flavobacteriaceae bacterium]|jgi:histidine ammonia-lyase|nr:histidine ammonia-lyase [Flavobacteriaceae bacterium]
MKTTFYIDVQQSLNLKSINELLQSSIRIDLSEQTSQKILECRTYLDHKMKTNDQPIYGINTGFGSLHNVKIKDNNLSKLQENLMLSHACGTGDKVPNIIVKLMLLLKIKSLSFGYSGVQLETVKRLIDLYNNDVLPVVYTQGSLGASGDLAPLAHLALPLIGKGEVVYKNKVMKAEKVCQIFNWTPITLKSKEGLALLNGTQFMSAYGIQILLKSHHISNLADIIGAMSLDAFDGHLEPFDELVHSVRPHDGQVKTAKIITTLLIGSELMSQKKQHVQDPYSFRCIPQVHGATKDTLAFVTKTFITEINSVTDNPNIFINEDKIISGGNFHGQPLALALDYLKIAMAELGNISERRTFQLISGSRGLPNFLVNNPGLNSGLMIPQYTAASIVSLNKQLATPASIDSIVSSNGQEDHVSMGANAATQAYQIINNLETILAIELLNASQALTLRAPLKTSNLLHKIFKSYRTKVPFIEEDKFLHEDISKSIKFIKTLQAEDFKHDE